MLTDSFMINMIKVKTKAKQNKQKLKLKQNKFLPCTPKQIKLQERYAITLRTIFNFISDGENFQILIVLICIAL